MALPNLPPVAQLVIHEMEEALASASGKPTTPETLSWIRTQILERIQRLRDQGKIQADRLPEIQVGLNPQTWHFTVELDRAWVESALGMRPPPKPGHH